MASANDSILQGRLGTDPNENTTKAGKLNISFTVANQPNKIYPPTWVQVFCYGKTVEIVQAQKLGKGDLVSITGALFNPIKARDTDCKFPHVGIRAKRVYLLVKARSSESKHYEDVEQTSYGEDEPPFA